MDKENLYEVEFEALNKKEVEPFENNNALNNVKLDVTVTIGTCKKSIKDIINFKEGDVICLNKTIDEDLDVNVNGKCIAAGESIKVDEKISVRITDFKKEEE